MLRVAKVGDLYKATVTELPWSESEYWVSGTMQRSELIRALSDRGWHSTDISDAFYAADPEWLARGD